MHALSSEGDRREELRAHEGSDRARRCRAEARRRVLRRSVSARRQQHGTLQTIPPWAHEGGGAKLAERLKDPATRAKIRKEMDDPHPTWENRLISAGTWHNVQLASIRQPAYKKFEGMRVDDAAKRREKNRMRLRLRDPDRPQRQCRLRLVHHRRERSEAGDAAAVGLGRIGWLGACHQRTASERRASPAQLRHLPARAGQVTCARST